MSQWLKSSCGLDYDFTDIHPYAQYREVDLIYNWCQALNSYIANGLDKFFKAYAKNLNLTDANVGAYSFYYLKNYFGMFSGALDLGSYIQNFYDSGYIKYDSYDESGKHYKYEDVSIDPLNNSSNFNGFYSVIAAIASWSLDRSHEVLNIPAIADLLKRAYKSFNGQDLDLNTIKFKDDTRNLKVILPNNAIWRFITRLSRFDLLFFNLPFDNSVIFEVDSSLTEGA